MRLITLQYKMRHDGKHKRTKESECRVSYSRIHRANGI